MPRRMSVISDKMKERTSCCETDDGVFIKICDSTDRISDAPATSLASLLRDEAKEGAHRIMRSLTDIFAMNHG
jgi:hypothetical protein